MTEWLRRADGKWLRASDASEAAPHAASPAIPDEVEADAVFDRPRVPESATSHVAGAR